MALAMVFSSAFELALRDADIEQQNLVSISSILPPHCTELDRVSGVATLQPGEITFTVLARAETNEPGRRVHASVVWRAQRTRRCMAEHYGHGMTKELSGDHAEDLATTMLASTLGIEFDPGAAWNERKRVYEASHLIIGSASITAYAEGDAQGRWTCAVAAAVFRLA